MRLAEFKAIIDLLCVAHADAKIDFSYPVKRGGKRVSKVGDMTSYKVILDQLLGSTLRIEIDYARE